MSISVFDSNDYRRYLVDLIEKQPSRGRGFRSLLAEKIGCQRTFISQVLRGDAHFNLEHGDAISRVLGHTPEEADFFLLLILYARAGTEPLRARHLQQMEEIREKRRVLKNRFKEEERLSIQDQMTYYSSWYYGAIRVLLTIPGFQTRAAIQERLKIAPEKLSETLEFLFSRGLITEKNGRYTPTQKHMFLGNDSPLIMKHHTNWRMRAIHSLEHEKAQDLHFSAVNSLSKEDVQKLRDTLTDTIQGIRNTVKDSKEEVLYTVCIDLFET